MRFLFTASWMLQRSVLLMMVIHWRLGRWTCLRSSRLRLPDQHEQVLSGMPWLQSFSQESMAVPLRIGHRPCACWRPAAIRYTHCSSRRCAIPTVNIFSTIRFPASVPCRSMCHCASWTRRVSDPGQSSRGSRPLGSTRCCHPHVLSCRPGDSNWPASSWARHAAPP